MPGTVLSYTNLSKEAKESLNKLSEDYDSGDLTLKGFWNKKIAILEDEINDEIRNQLLELKANMKNGTLSKEEFYEDISKVLAIFDPIKMDDSEVPEGRSPRLAKVKGQQSITAMFDKLTSKRKSSEDSERLEKRAKGESSDSLDAVKTEQTSASVDASASKRCVECRQYLDDPDLKCFSGDSSEALEEFVTLTDPRLSLFDADSEAATIDERPLHKITAFSVYDKCTHLCAFDDGLIEKNKELFFSGYVKPIFDDNPSIDGGIPTTRIGPINEWFTHGFDGAFPVIGFSTAFADYYLMEPSDEYEGFMNIVREKVFLSNLVISSLVENENATYEDLLNKLQIATPPKGVVCSLTEDTLLRHAQFICDQVESFDSAADEDEGLIISMPCMRALIKLAGVTLGKGRKGRRQMTTVDKKDKPPKDTLATTTPLVMGVFDSMFKGVIDDKLNAVRRRRCNQCEVCLAPDCGKCNACKNMVKFGGNGKSKQACLLRRCSNMVVAEADEAECDAEEGVEDDMDKKVKETRESKNKRKLKKAQKGHLKFIGEAIHVIGSKEYFLQLSMDGEVYSVGDFVSVNDEEHPDEPDIGRIQYMWKNSDGDAKIHIRWFIRGTETLLGETSDKHELFLIDDCETCDPASIQIKVSVTFDDLPSDWYSLGGLVTGDRPIPANTQNVYFYKQWYDVVLGRFEDIPSVPKQEGVVDFCESCVRLEVLAKKEQAQLGEKLETSTAKRALYGNVKYQGYDYAVGSCCFVSSDAFHFDIQQPTKKTKMDSKKIDEELYPEAYRKSSAYIKGSNEECPEPFRVVRILEICCKGSEEPENVTLKVAKFYRPENTHRGSAASHQADLHLLYWSDEEAVVGLSSTAGTVAVRYLDDEEQDALSLFSEGIFYFREAYNPTNKEFVEPPSEASNFSIYRSKGGKGKGKGKGSAKAVPASAAREDIEEAGQQWKTLRCLDVFAGCGGLSEGLHQAGVAESLWAIEKDEPAAQAYRLNSPGCTVFTDDCNDLLKLAMEGEPTNRAGQKLPQKGDVELLCGGPPCQGFSGMNRFNSREYSRFKNSLIASYLSYCDYYRPKFFILENVRNFVSYKSSMVLKMALRCLVAMGYQCTFGVLQAGSYGVAQTRRRAIILAAAPGEKLPFYPEPSHVFAPRAMQLSVVIDDRKYNSNITRCNGAPYRTITVRDALSDLPEIKNGHRKEEISYNTEPESQFQKMIRGKQHQPVLRDHICKEMSPLVAARMAHIPTAPGSDWRDLPNLEVRLSDGTKCKLLKYTHHDQKNGKGPRGVLRGVCTCAEGEKCDPEDRQFNTLIPWCLPHTGNRHNHWAGLYGRLEWDGFFSTTVTNPEPMGKQGRVLHPTQHRVVSVRECARSQGFPDAYRFYGNILDKHRQVGNAVPPPLGKALGEEVKKSLIHRVKQSSDDLKA